jgi:hypothetical protein
MTSCGRSSPRTSLPHHRFTNRSPSSHALREDVRGSGFGAPGGRRCAALAVQRDVRLRRGLGFTRDADVRWYDMRMLKSRGTHRDAHHRKPLDERWLRSG